MTSSLAIEMLYRTDDSSNTLEYEMAGLEAELEAEGFLRFKKIGPLYDRSTISEPTTRKLTRPKLKDQINSHSSRKLTLDRGSNIKAIRDSTLKSKYLSLITAHKPSTISDTPEPEATTPSVTPIKPQTAPTPPVKPEPALPIMVAPEPVPQITAAPELAPPTPVVPVPASSREEDTLFTGPVIYIPGGLTVRVPTSDTRHRVTAQGRKYTLHLNRDGTLGSLSFRKLCYY